MGEPHGVGIVGLGVISQQYLATIGSHPLIRIAAVADLDQARAEAVAESTGATALSVADLVAHPDVDTVLNLTIPAAHKEIALAAIGAGKGVFGEKPLASGFDDGAAIVTAGRDGGVPVGSAPDTVLGTGTQTARAVVDAGRIGQPISALATMYTPGHERWHPNPDFYYREGGGPLLDMGPYYVSSLVQILGPVVRVTGASSRLRDIRTIGSGPREGEQIGVSIDTHVTGILEHANGALSTLVTSFDGTATTASSIEIHGASGSLVVPDPNTFGGDVRLRSTGETEWGTVPAEAGFEDGARGIGLLDFIRTPSGDQSRASGSFALHVLDIMTSMLRSAEEGRRIDLTTSVERPPVVPLTPATEWRAWS